MRQLVHPSHVEALDAQHGVLADQQAAQLVMSVLPQADDAPVNGVDPTLRLAPTLGTYRAPGQRSLPPAQFPQMFAQRSGVANRSRFGR